MTPAQRHNGEDKAILAKRHELYTKAQKKNLTAGQRGIRNWEEIGDVKLNPENKKEAALTAQATTTLKNAVSGRS